MYDQDGEPAAPEDVLDQEEMAGLSPERQRFRRLPMPGAVSMPWPDES